MHWSDTMVIICKHIARKVLNYLYKHESEITKSWLRSNESKLKFRILTRKCLVECWKHAISYPRSKLSVALKYIKSTGSFKSDELLFDKLFISTCTLSRTVSFRSMDQDAPIDVLLSYYDKPLIKVLLSV